MKIFSCDECGSLVFFENVKCIKCQKSLGFLPDALDISTLEAENDKAWRALSPVAKGQQYRSCQNAIQYQTCNWLIPDSDANPLCYSCRLNQTIPDLSLPENRERWFKLETAKRRLIYTLIQLQLPVEGNVSEQRAPLRFSFLADPPGGPPVLSGHSQGLITLNIAEADDAVREERRVSLHEPYRTLLGHFRHEIAHYYWDQLIANTPLSDPFRRLFGDESRDYGQALAAYYQQGPNAEWPLHHVSAYASAHPWEDWAETWAHYLHIRDTLETAASFGVSLKPKHPDAKAMTANPKAVAENDSSFDRILHHWLPLTYALNEFNRGLGILVHYPFVLW